MNEDHGGYERICGGDRQRRSQYGSVKSYPVLKTINTGVFIMIPVPLCLTCLDRNFDPGFFTTLGLFLWTLSGIF
jgi:hypothetical protein